MRRINLCKIAQEIGSTDKKVRQSAICRLLSFTKGYDGLYKIDKELHNKVVTIIQKQRETALEKKRIKIINKAKKYNEIIGKYREPAMIPTGTTL
jgi:hypothetical protein